MPQTIITTASPQTKKYWASELFTEYNNDSYFGSRFVGKGDRFVIQQMTELETGAGDKITYDLSVRLRQKPTVGDNRLKGREEQLRLFNDEVVIDQMRHSVGAGGKMTRKRTVYDLRATAKARMSEYWTKYMDELMFIYLSGARGINEDFTEDTSFTGHAGNAILAPDSDHVLYGGTVSAKAALTASDKMSRDLIERAETRARMFQAKNPEAQNMAPVMIGGSAHYVVVMSPFQEHDLRTADTAGWVDFQKAAAAAEGKSNAIFNGNLGMLKNVVLHSHASVVRFNDYGAGSNVLAARALFMGRQAGIIAFGTAGSGLRFSWEEELEDYKNELTIAAGLIVGVKKTRFNGRDFGVLSLDTAAKDPNP